jgi:hypothetical protein
MRSFAKFTLSGVEGLRMTMAAGLAWRMDVFVVGNPEMDPLPRARLNIGEAFGFVGVT